MPAWRIAARERGQDPGRRQYVGYNPARTWASHDVTSGRPPQQARTANGKDAAGLVGKGEKRAIGQVVNLHPVPTLGAPIEALGVQHAIHRGRTGNGLTPTAASKGRSKRLCIGAPALEAGPMTGGKRGRLVEKE
jgi:hypothetical protein